MSADEPHSLIDALGYGFIHTVIPAAIVICYITAFLILRKARSINAPVGFRYFVYSTALYVFALAIPFLAFPLRLVLESPDSASVSNFLLVVTTAAICGATFFLAKGTRLLRSNDAG